LLRRVWLDLVGLPPSVEAVEAFVADRSPGAYERVVDRLLASPHYGERMALKWLDLARYADTHGYHIDSHRDMWRWRDWVIEAFNRNLPFDQFIVQQIAGDLLPNATLDQIIATGFNRNHPINFEGGAIPEEYQVAYVADRVDTTATAMLGLTLRCGQCHDHKYDPFTQKDYYRFYAFFNTIAENGLDGQNGNAAPFIKAPLPGQMEQLQALAEQVARAEQEVKAREAETAAQRALWEQNAPEALRNSESLTRALVAHYALDEGTGAQTRPHIGTLPAATIAGKAEWVEGRVGRALRLDGQTHVVLGSAGNWDHDDRFSCSAWVHPIDNRHMTVLSRMNESPHLRGWDLYLGDGRVFAHLIHRWDDNAIRVNTRQTIPPGQWTHLCLTYDGSGKASGLKIYINGRPAELEITHDRLSGTIAVSAPTHLGRRATSAPFVGQIDEVYLYQRTLTPSEVALLAGRDIVLPLLAITPDRRTPEQQQAITQFYLETQDPIYPGLLTALREARQRHAEFDASIPTTMIMKEMEKPRDTFILIRGQYDQFGEKVTPGVPASLPPLPAGAPANRLGLAQWLVHPSNPLVARVAVNRLWEMVFGVGLVKTAEDFGVQGERPSHPELLDWLATEFIRMRWDTKAFMKLLVTSSTYRQSSRVTPSLLRKDPENRLLARGPRHRLQAEFVRDLALAVSGLLVPKIGGPSVKPYHPPGLWEEMAFGGGFSAQTYVQDHGENLYRRSLYTFWKRTVPPPSLQTFDAPEREFCVVRRSTTNTPLQALVLMNDPTYVEAARKFAERILLKAHSPASRIALAYRIALARDPRPAETRILLRAFHQQWNRFRRDRAAAEQLLGVGESPRHPGLDVAELAAWTTVTSILLTLDETISKG
ncbi:MAG: DUF1553 domain-containing protein, partial [Chthonomonadaceae bacterium]|nr:DUF1553 domain-containing protein [Chthonomonadaceae bacterium]